MRDSGFLTWPEMKEHMHYLAWLCFSLVSFPAGGHAAVLVLCVSLGEYVDQQRLMVTVLAAVLLGPAAYVWRKYGERYCRFAELDETFERALRGTGVGGRLRELEVLIAAIDEAAGMERQVARNKAKQWIQAYAPEFTEEERQLVSEHLGYLCKW